MRPFRSRSVQSARKSRDRKRRAALAHEPSSSQGTATTMSLKPAALATRGPVIRIAVRPFFPASVKPLTTFGELPPVLIPSATSPGLPNGSIWRSKIWSYNKSFPQAVITAASQQSATAGGSFETERPAHRKGAGHRKHFRRSQKPRACARFRKHLRSLRRPPQGVLAAASRQLCGTRRPFLPGGHVRKAPGALALSSCEQFRSYVCQQSDLLAQYLL